MKISRGFTLIELLVVIAIIAILAAMLLPALHQARASALTMQCVSNCKQVSTAALLYTDAFDECLTADFTNGKLWVELLLPYLEGNRAAYDCPMRTGYNVVEEVDTDGSQSDLGWNYAGTRANDTAASPDEWGLGYRVPGGSARTYSGKCIKLTDVPVPDGTIMLGDRRSTNADLAICGPADTSTSIDSACIHSSKACVAWVDGHATSELLPRLKYTKNWWRRRD